MSPGSLPALPKLAEESPASYLPPQPSPLIHLPLKLICPTPPGSEREENHITTVTSTPSAGPVISPSTVYKAVQRVPDYTVTELTVLADVSRPLNLPECISKIEEKVPEAKHISLVNTPSSTLPSPVEKVIASRVCKAVQKVPDYTAAELAVLAGASRPFNFPECTSSKGKKEGSPDHIAPSNSTPPVPLVASPHHTSPPLVSLVASPHPNPPVLLVSSLVSSPPPTSPPPVPIVSSPPPTSHPPAEEVAASPVNVVVEKVPDYTLAQLAVLSFDVSNPLSLSDSESSPASQSGDTLRSPPSRSNSFKGFADLSRPRTSSCRQGNFNKKGSPGSRLFTTIPNYPSTDNIFSQPRLENPHPSEGDQVEHLQPFYKDPIDVNQPDSVNCPENDSFGRTEANSSPQYQEIKQDLEKEDNNSVSLSAEISCSHSILCPQSSFSYNSYCPKVELPGMYGRHYRAFRDSRRNARPGGIVYIKFNKQDFYEILDDCDCKRRYFNDRTFPPDISSLIYMPFKKPLDIATAAERIMMNPGSTGDSSRKSSFRSSSHPSSKDGESSLKMGNIVWKRPKELNPKSRLLNGGKMFRGDLAEGMRGSPLFAAACSALALKHELLFQVMPDDQCPIAFEDDWGIYKFRFWRFGSWTEVTIDDKLPIIEGELLYTHTLSNDEHWMCLMEKAYAKFNGCYDVINKIPLSDMLQHLTGGITETLPLVGHQRGPDNRSESDNLGIYLENCLQKRALILAVAAQTKEGTMLGLESDTPYVVTRIKRGSRDWPLLVCLYSPFGCCSWSGAWGKDSDEWNRFSSEEIHNIGLANESDFDFWIPVDDLCVFFENIYITHQASDNITGPIQEFDPCVVSLVRCGLYGNWIRGKTDGGAPSNSHFLTHNIQYLITQNSFEESLCIISLVQRFRPRTTPHEGFMCIGFSVFKVPVNMQYCMTDLLDMPVAMATYSFKESVTVRMNMEPGNYVIIPSTYQSGVTGEYLLRCISAKNLNIRVLKMAPASITKKHIVEVELVGGENLPDATHSHEADPEQGVYCVIMCGKEKCQVPVKTGLNPIWNTSATFHVKNPYRKTVKIQVWYKLDKGVKLQNDICIAETRRLPIIVGDHKVTSHLSFVKKNFNKSANILSRAAVGFNKRGAISCTGVIVLLIRCKSAPTEFNGLHPSAFNSLPSTAFNSLPPSAFNSLPPSAFNSLPPSAFNSLPPSAFNSLPPSAFNSLPPSNVQKALPGKRKLTEIKGLGAPLTSSYENLQQITDCITDASVNKFNDLDSRSPLPCYTSNNYQPITLGNFQQSMSHLQPTATINRISPQIRRQRRHTEKDNIPSNSSLKDHVVPKNHATSSEDDFRKGKTSSEAQNGGSPYSVEDLITEDDPLLLNVNCDKTLSPKQIFNPMATSSEINLVTSKPTLSRSGFSRSGLSYTRTPEPPKRVMESSSRLGKGSNSNLYLQTNL